MNKIIRDNKGRFLKGSVFSPSKEQNIKISNTRKRLFKEGKLRIIKNKDTNKKTANSLKKWWKKNKGSEKIKERNKNISRSKKGKRSYKEHPRGMLGKHHTKDAKMKIRKNSYTKSLPNNWGRHTKEAKIKIGLANKAEKSHLWKGGITPLNKEIRHLKEYFEWIKSVFKRDNYACRRCEYKGRELQIHHIIPFYKIIKENKIKSIQEALDYKELWDINNGLTLCKNCHNIIGEKINQHTIQKLRTKHRNKQQ